MERRRGGEIGESAGATQQLRRSSTSPIEFQGWVRCRQYQRCFAKFAVTGQFANSIEGPSKPKLVARSAEPKSPWKYHKIPVISVTGVPKHLRPLFSYMLWLLHEYENDPL